MLWLWLYLSLILCRLLYLYYRYYFSSLLYISSLSSLSSRKGLSDFWSFSEGYWQSGLYICTSNFLMALIRLAIFFLAALVTIFVQMLSISGRMAVASRRVISFLFFSLYSFFSEGFSCQIRRFGLGWVRRGRGCSSERIQIISMAVVGLLLYLCGWGSGSGLSGVGVLILLVAQLFCMSLSKKGLVILGVGSQLGAKQLFCWWMKSGLGRLNGKGGSNGYCANSERFNPQFLGGKVGGRLLKAGQGGSGGKPWKKKGLLKLINNSEWNKWLHTLMQDYAYKSYRIIAMIKKLGIALNLLSMLYPKTAKTLQVIGLVLVAKNLLSLLSSLYKVILRRRRNFKRRYGENSWALVTGSSDGIGKAIAFSLARQGFNIILSARTEFKLDMVRVELRRTFSDIDVKVLVADYANSHLPGFLDEKMSELDGLDISIVVNNVGVDVLDHYQNLSEQQITNLVNLNCFSVTLMNRIFIPRFRARHAERGFRSAIVNVSSLAGEIPMPLHNVYSASKVFVDYLSRALSYENRGKIDIISLRPSQVSTPMTLHKKTDIMTIMPKDCAQGLLNDLGHETVTNGYWSHQLQGVLYKAVPECVFNYIWYNFVGPDFIRERRLSREMERGS